MEKRIVNKISSYRSSCKHAQELQLSNVIQTTTQTNTEELRSISFDDDQTAPCP